MDRDQVLFRLFGKYSPEGTILYTEGSPGEELYLIQSGAVRLGDARPERGKEGPLGPGDILGEEAFFGTAVRACRAEVLQDTRFIQVNDRTLDAVVRHGPRAALQIAERLVALADSARGELEAWTIGHVLRRVAPHLIAVAGGLISPADLAERSGQADSDVSLVLEKLRIQGCLLREGAAYRAADAALLQQGLDELVDGGQGA